MFGNRLSGDGGLEPIDAEDGREGAGAIAEPTNDLAACDEVSWPHGIFGALVSLSSFSVYAYFAWASRLTTPYGDDHDWMAKAIDQGGHLTADYLFSPHNNQLIVWVRLLAWFSAVTGREESLFLTAGVCSALLAAATLTAVPLLLGVRRPAGAWIGVLGGLLFLDTAGVQDAAWPVFSVYILGAGFAAIALALFEISENSGRPHLAVLAALVFAVVASLGNAAGLVVWPVMALRALQGQRTTRTTVVVVSLGLAMVLFGAKGLFTAQAIVSESGGVRRILKIVFYFGNFCALPLGSGSFHLERALLGWVLALIGVALLWRSSPLQGPPGRLARFGQSLILFGLAAGTLAAFGRVDEAPQPVVPARYAPFADLLHVGLFFAACPWVLIASTRWPKGAQSTVVFGCALLLTQQVFVGRKIELSSHLINHAGDAFDRGNRTFPVTSLLYPSAAREEILRRKIKNAARRQ